MKNMILIMVMMFLLSSVATSAWWNENYTARYELNITNPSGFDMQYEAAHVDISGVACNFSDKRDLRLIDNNDNEIPRQILSGYNDMVIIGNYSKGNNHFGYVYCGNGLVSEPEYNGLILHEAENLAGSGTPVWNITLDESGTNYRFNNGFMQYAYSPMGFKIGAMQQGIPTLRAGADFFYGAGNTQTCNILENGSLYLSIECTNTINSDVVVLDFYYMSKIFKVKPALVTTATVYAFSIDSGGGGGGGQKIGTYANTLSTIATYTGTGAATMARGIAGAADSTLDYGLFGFWNLSAVNENDFNDFAGTFDTAANRPYMAFFSTNNDGVQGQATKTGLNNPALNFWFGIAKKEDTQSIYTLNYTYYTKMNPIIINMGSIESYALSCTPNWSCDTFKACSAENITECLSVTDSEDCGEIFGGNLTDYNGVCEYVFFNTESVNLANFNLNEPKNLVIYGLFIFLWVSLAYLSLISGNIIFKGFFAALGLVLMFMSLQIHFVIAAAFALFSLLGLILLK